MIAILTGATGGIGIEFLKQLQNEDVDEIWAIARDKKKLETLRKHYGEKVKPFSVDLSNLEQIKEFGKVLQEEKPQIKYLINNAGLGKMGAYKDFSIGELDRIVNVNSKAPVLLCNLCIPYMEEGSRIVNVSSASAFQPAPYINLYAASKAFTRSYSRGLNMKLKSRGITATAVCPSWVATELLPKELNGKRVKYPGIVTADKVAAQALKDAKKGKDMSVYSMFVKSQHLIVKLLPQKLVMKIWLAGIKKYLG
mgnify:CR=1 FL=1